WCGGVGEGEVGEGVAVERRRETVAWYSLAGSRATAVGALLCGLVVQFLQAPQLEKVQSYRVVLLAYAGAGLLLAALFTRLSPAAEAPAPAAGEGLPRRFLGLHRSRGVVVRLSLLFA